MLVGWQSGWDSVFEVLYTSELAFDVFGISHDG